jgi:hypothetical protein
MHQSNSQVFGCDLSSGAVHLANNQGLAAQVPHEQPRAPAPSTDSVKSSRERRSDGAKTAAAGTNGVASWLMPIGNIRDLSVASCGGRIT